MVRFMTTRDIEAARQRVAFAKRRMDHAARAAIAQRPTAKALADDALAELNAARAALDKALAAVRR